MKLSNYVAGRWTEGRGTGVALLDPVLGTELARASTESIDFAGALEYGRHKGGPVLRALSYAERAGLLKSIAEVLSANRKTYLDIALANSGSPEGDASIDIDGAIFTLKYYARIGAALGGGSYLKDGELVRLAKDEAFQALHISQPLRGVAILINAFNFPAWGLWEKASPALLSGMPVFAKPATATAWLTQRMVQDVVGAAVLPDGALSVVCGGAGDLLDHVTAADVVSFTGSAETALRIRGHAAVLRHSTRVNVEADSLNAALLGPEAKAGTPEFDLLVREVVREMTVKAGQKCTAIRRVLAPADQCDAVADAIRAKLAKIVVGNPRNKDVRMGPLVSKSQQQAALEGLAALKRETSVVFDGGPDFRPLDADPTLAAFVPPTLLSCGDALAAHAVHDVEVFGPAATVVPYAGAEQAFAIARLGQGSLVASVFSADAQFLRQAAVELAESHGRVLAVNAAIGSIHTGHGNVMPQCMHGGPGRAGGGEELGGLRALAFYHRRSAIQGPVECLDGIAAQAAELRY
ncbi:MAG: phenylacetic acid degradation bifunctional protein PaaZ [Betaproteobacteria bacterium RIFCSPLOWO2_12_FULL_63_13]|nr:MAG: phenylacetic acid degradation bifunctional protein PaaZ [Betaproteobacteria bacterium RIFCSPLOWO2_12_FULL_63_13]